MDNFRFNIIADSESTFKNAMQNLNLKNNEYWNFSR